MDLGLVDRGAPALTADPGRDDGGAAPNAALAAEPGRVDGGAAPRDSALRQTRDAALIGVRSDATLSFVRSRSAERRSAGASGSGVVADSAAKGADASDGSSSVSLSSESQRESVSSSGSGEA